MKLFATTARGLAPMLADELLALGAERTRAHAAGVEFQGSLETAYRACLWSRLASRVLVPIAAFDAGSGDALYAGTRAVLWREHLDPHGSFAVRCHARHAAISHTHFAVQRVKDAIVDQFREAIGIRPDVARVRPDVQIDIFLHRDEATLAIDLAGESLHRRGYRLDGGEAPLKETLAAALLVRSGWPAIAAADHPFVDPMCGSGTLVIEAASMAGDVAPGIGRTYFGLLAWRGHDAPLWEGLRREAEERRAAGLSRRHVIQGFDASERAVREAGVHLERAGLAANAEVRQCALAGLRPPSGHGAGLLLANPPYGERLGEAEALEPLYRELGGVLRAHFAGWQAGVITSDAHLAGCLGLRAKRRHTFYNGALECRLSRFDIATADARERRETRLPEPPAPPPALPDDPGARMFANRLAKNLRHLGRWARREAISCYRLYAADMPEFAVAVDLYQADRLWANLQEYEAPATVDPKAAARRLRTAATTLAHVLDIPRTQVIVKRRRRQRGPAQYEPLADGGQRHTVTEDGCRLLVNLTDRLDTGLFLDHRPTRRLIQSMAAGRDFLNLFAYTGAASVHAARGGARTTTSVDLSAAYVDWGKDNLALNGFDPELHEYVRADCLQWLAAQVGTVWGAPRYGLIFLDPPTFSNSKRMRGVLDLQRDHAALVNDAARLLTDDGTLLFSTNSRRFELDTAALTGLVVEDITRATIAQDFARDPRVHRCWRIRLGAGC